ncbi:MAG: FAD binding domain-containing protein [Lachnospiraceae bacterium]|nr:FAD binding domain-containing protein [Lachnospiraceae bacterium]
MNCKNYIKPKNLEELKEILKNTDGEIKYLAGGTDLLIQEREKHHLTDSTIIDIFGMNDLKYIREENDKIRIGAATTHTEISENTLINTYASILSKACSSIGSILTRNHATLVGNVCNASPAADSLSSLIVLNAKFKVLRNGNFFFLFLSDIIDKPNHNTLQNKDLVVEVIVDKLKPDTKSFFFKLGRRKALAISRMTISIICHQIEDKTIDDFNISCGATFPKPMIFADINNILLNKKPSSTLISQVAKSLSEKIPEITGIRKSTSYKQPVCELVTKNLLTNLLLNED